MNKIITTFFVVCLAWTRGPIYSDEPKSGLRPTIVVFLADDHGQLDSKPYGSLDARTPNLQRLADEGLTFTRAFVASPSCAPSRGAMLTGLMPARNGAEANHTFKRDQVASLPEVMRKIGYQTAAFGKIAHGKNDTARHGFDHIDLDHRSEVVQRFLADRDKSKPLCLFVGTHSPHVPWPENNGYDPKSIALPPKFVDTPETRVQWTKYLSGVTQADTDLGEIRELVRNNFLSSDTLFIYSSDHGGQWPFGKWNLYDSGIRVPFIAAWSGVIAPNRRTEAMIQWIDLFPTLIDIVGGPVPTDIDGRSFAEVLRGTKSEHRKEIYATHSGDRDKNIYPIRSLRTEQFKYILNILPNNAHTTHIDQGGGSGDGWRFFDEWVTTAKSDSKAAKQVEVYHRRPKEELYDLKNDPNEMNNLASNPLYKVRLSEMHAQLESWMKSQNDQQTVFEKPRTFENLYPERK